MRIGILSDTHDQIARTGLAVRRLADEGAVVLIHCGDLTRPEIIDEFAVLKTYFVFGNNDYDESGLRRAMNVVGGVCLERGGELTLAGKKIAVTHGDSNKELQRLTALNPDYLFFGHSHFPADSREGTTRFINPGALYRASSYTVALLDLEADSLRMLSIRDRL